MEHGDRVGGARLCLEDRRLGPAVRPGRAGVVSAEHAASVPARRLVPRPRRDAERGELHQRPAVVAGRVHAAERLRPASLRPLLQRQQVRRRDRPVRGARRHQEALPDRRRPAGDARLLDGRRRLLAVRRPLSRASGPPPRRAPASPRRPTSSRSSRTRRSSRPGTSRSSGTSTTAPTTPSTCSTARPSPTAARTTARSRPPT